MAGSALSACRPPMVAGNETASSSLETLCVRRRAGRLSPPHRMLLVAVSLGSAVVLFLAGDHATTAVGRQLPLALRERTRKLRDPYTGMPRPVPEKVIPILDRYARQWPESTTEEHVIIRRWEDIVDTFGSIQDANFLCDRDPTILRRPRGTCRQIFYFLSLYLGAETAREVVFMTPYVMARTANQVRKAMPALLNVFGTREKLAQILKKYPGMVTTASFSFYEAMPQMIAVAGSPENALEVAKPAMDRLRRSPLSKNVPTGYPALIQILGSLEAAHKAINREPYLLKEYGDSFFGKLRRLRQLMGSKSAAREILKKAPYLLLRESSNRVSSGIRKAKFMTMTFEAMKPIFGLEETRRMVLERPELLAMGVELPRALGFAKKKLGSWEAVGDQWESILVRTGLIEDMIYAQKPRPREGYWSPGISAYRTGTPAASVSAWSPARNPSGRDGPARGRWDEDPDEAEDGGEEVGEINVQDAEMVEQAWSVAEQEAQKDAGDETMDDDYRAANAEIVS